MLLPNPAQKWDAQAQAAANQILMQADAQNVKRNQPAELGSITITDRVNPYVALRDGTNVAYLQVVAGKLNLYAVDGHSANFTRGQMQIGPQDDANEGGEITLDGGPNGAGVDFQAWHIDNFAGLLRMYVGVNTYCQMDGLGRTQFIGPGTTAVVEANGTASLFRWWEADQGTNEKVWDMLVDSKTFSFRTVTDDLNTAVNIFTLTRGTGTAFGAIRLNTAIDFLVNNAYDIGSGGNYPRDIGFAGKITASGTQVVSTRRTGWTVATGTAQRGTFATDTVTLINLARAVKALIDDLHSTAGHGLIGT